MRRETFLNLLQETKKLLIEEKQHRSFLFTKPFLLPLSEPKKPEKIEKPLREEFKKPEFKIPEKITKPAQELDNPVATSKISDTIKEIDNESVVLSNQLQTPPSDSLLKAIQKSCPHLRLKTTIPNDDEAIQRKNAWKQREHEAEILFFSFTTNPIEKAFLENIAKAVCTLHRKTQVIHALEAEKEHSWKALLEMPELRFIFSPPLETWKTPLLKSLVIENPATREVTLGKARLFFFPSLEKALSEPLNKRKLWQWIEQKINSQA